MSDSGKTLEQLVDGQLAGTLSGAEQQALEAMLASSENARRYLREMERLHAMLMRAGGGGEGPDLSPRVMERIEEEQESRRQATRTINMADWFRFERKELLRYAAILLIGLALGVALTLVVTPGRLFVDPSGVSATMSARSSQSMSFVQDGWQIQLSPMVVDQMVILVASVRSEELLDVRLWYDRDTYRFVRGRYLKGSGMEGDQGTGGVTRFSVQGEAVYQLVLTQLEGMSKPILLEVSDDQRGVLFSREMIIR